MMSGPGPGSIVRGVAVWTLHQLVYLTLHSLCDGMVWARPYLTRVHSLLTTDVSDSCIELQWAASTTTPTTDDQITDTDGIQGVRFYYHEAPVAGGSYSSRGGGGGVMSESDLLPVRESNTYEICGLLENTHYVICVWLVRNGHIYNDTRYHQRNCVDAATGTEDTAVYIGSSIGAVVFVILFMIFLCVIRIKCSLFLPKVLGRKGSRRRRGSRNSRNGSIRMKDMSTGGVGSPSAGTRAGTSGAGPSTSEAPRDTLLHTDSSDGCIAGGEISATVNAGCDSDDACALCDDTVGASVEDIDGDDDNDYGGGDMDQLAVPSTSGHQGHGGEHQPLRSCNSAPAFHCLTALD